MSVKIGIIYSTVDGQTLKICKKIVEHLAEQNVVAKLFSIEEFNEDILSFDKIIIGASIRSGVHNEKIIKFIKTNK